MAGNVPSVDWKTRPLKERCDAFVAAYLSLRDPEPTNEYARIAAASDARHANERMSWLLTLGLLAHGMRRPMVIAAHAAPVVSPIFYLPELDPSDWKRPTGNMRVFHLGSGTTRSESYPLEVALMPAHREPLGARIENA